MKNVSSGTTATAQAANAGTSTADASSSSGRIPRRHDLDALRAIAMLAGVVLHGMLSYVPGTGEAWPVHDIRQHAGFDVGVSAMHGFRMQLFFLISGFFTAMLWRDRGLQALIDHRLKRVFLPLIVCMFTIIPLTWIAAIGSGIATSAFGPEIEQRASAANRVGQLGTSDDPVRPVSVSPHQATDALANASKPKFQDAPQRADDTWNGVIGLFVFLGMIPVFFHLWFLWFLCWLVAMFPAYALIMNVMKWRSLSSRLIATPLRYVWLIPVTLLPQSIMGLLYPTFGPDTAPGIVPFPHLLFYYAIFFFFGAMYFDCDDRERLLGRWWRVTIPIALVVVFPIGYETTKGGLGFVQLVDGSLHRPISVVAQVVYAWLMTFGLMGLFRELFSRESKVMRYVSDSSYWLYIAHLPLMFVLQAIVCRWQLPSIIKCTLVCTVACAILLVSYRYGVRYTAIGKLLNGPRNRGGSEPVAIPAEVIS